MRRQFVSIFLLIYPLLVLIKIVGLSSTMQAWMIKISPMTHCFIIPGEVRLWLCLFMFICLQLCLSGTVYFRGKGSSGQNPSRRRFRWFFPANDFPDRFWAFVDEFCAPCTPADADVSPWYKYFSTHTHIERDTGDSGHTDRKIMIERLSQTHMRVQIRRGRERERREKEIHSYSASVAHLRQRSVMRLEWKLKLHIVDLFAR